MEKILISRCLLGHAVRYDGGASGPFDQLTMWQAEGRVVAICPEVAGGLPTPRPAAEIAGGQGVDVWEGRAQVLTAEGEHWLRTSLKTLHTQLDPEYFWLIHRSILVNIRHVSAAHRDERGKWQLSLTTRPERLPVAAQYVHLFRQG